MKKKLLFCTLILTSAAQAMEYLPYLYTMMTIASIEQQHGTTDNYRTRPPRPDKKKPVPCKQINHVQTKKKKKQKCHPGKR